MKEVLAFVCDFCPRKKRYAVRGTARHHEQFCYYNPVMRACATCRHFIYVPEIFEPDGYSDGGPVCAKDMLDDSPESSTPLRHHCEGWELKTTAVVPLKSVRGEG